MNPIIESYFAAGLNCIPIRPGEKTPKLEIGGVERLRKSAAGPEEYGDWEFPIAVNAGAPSGGVVCIDFDDGGSCFEEWKQIVEDTRPGTVEHLTIEKTPSGGFHAIYRAPVDIGNLKLASKGKDEVKGGKTGLIETRGTGGYFVCAPSPGYELLQGSLAAPAVASEETHELLISAARSMNRAKQPEVATKKTPGKKTEGEKTPYDDYDERCDPLEEITAAGWQTVAKRGEAVYLRRPGKTTGISASWNHIPGRFYVFTTSTEFENEHCYKPSAVYAVLRHGGNWSLAAAALRKAGYGSAPRGLIGKKPPAAPPAGAPPMFDGSTLDLSLPFDILGFDDDAMVYRRKKDGYVARFNHSEHTLSAFLTLATSSDWSAVSGLSERRAWVPWVQEFLLRRSINKGRFDSRSIRGYGAWMDGGRPVFCAGETIKADGKEIPLMEFKTSFFYSQQLPLDPEFKAEQHPEIKTVFERVGFSEINKMLFGGWCTIAPIGGALSWRPHIWITADKGAGKSTIMDNIVRPLIEHCVAATSSTTEAGLRQDLHNNALPVLFDEAETKTQKTSENMDRVLELARAASHNGAPIIKGSPSGKTTSYTVRSCFCFASIITGTKEAADESRITVFEYKKMVGEDWKKLSAAMNSVLTKKTCAEQRLYVISNIENILKSIKVISDEILRIGQNSRFADQYSPMLAGWWHIDHQEVIDETSALLLVGEMEKTDIINGVDEKAGLDCQQCLDMILTTAANISGSERKPIRKIIMEADDEKNGQSFVRKETLAMYGMAIVRVKLQNNQAYLAIHTKNNEFHRLFKGEMFNNAGGIGRLLSRLDGALVNYTATIDKKPYRCVMIPMHLITGEKPEVEAMDVFDGEAKNV